MLDDAGSDACAKVQDRLLKAWNAIEPNAEACGSALFRLSYRIKFCIAVFNCS